MYVCYTMHIHYAMQYITVHYIYITYILQYMQYITHAHIQRHVNSPPQRADC